MIDNTLTGLAFVAAGISGFTGGVVAMAIVDIDMFGVAAAAAFVVGFSVASCSTNSTSPCCC